MTDDRHMDETRPDQNEPAGGDGQAKPGDTDAGTDDVGEGGADSDILGKNQADLDADDLSGDAREADVE